MGSAYRVPVEPVVSRMRGVLGEFWHSQLASKMVGTDRALIDKAVRRARKAGGITLAMVEKWCDAIRVHPCFVVADYHWHVEQDQGSEEKILAREAQQRMRAKRKAARS